MTPAEHVTLAVLLNALAVAPDRRVAFLRVARRPSPSAAYTDALRRIAEAPPGCVLDVARALRLELAAACDRSPVSHAPVIH